MTADEIRALEAEVGEFVFAGRVHDIRESHAFRDFARRREYHEYPLLVVMDTGLWLIRDAQEAGIRWCPITDPAATAEVKREAFRRGWQYTSGFDPDSTPEEEEFTRVACAQIIAWDAPPEKGNTFEITENLTNHDGDPIHAEAVALVKAFLQACRATGATATAETAEQAVTEGEVGEGQGKEL